MNKADNKPRPHFVIFGAGSIGCYLGGCLTAAGSEVTLIGRPRLQQQLSEHGLHLTDWQGRNTRIPPDKVNFSLSSSVMASADYILVTVKSGDTEVAAQSIAADASPAAVIVSFQNGLHNTEALQGYLPNHKVLKGMVPFNVISNGNGHFHCGTEGDLALEEQENPETVLIEALQQAQLPVQSHKDMLGIQSSKLLLNLNNAVNALSGIPLRDQLYNTNYRKVMAATIKEALRVMNAAGIKPIRAGKVIPAALPYILSLPTWLFKRVASTMLKMDPAARSSMYEDLQLGRTTEVDFLNGEIVSLAQQHHLSAPINSAIVELIKQAEQENAGSPMMKADQLLHYVSNGMR